MTNADEFLDLYRRLEEASRRQYGMDVYDLEKLPQFSGSKIKYCREVRNLLSHKPKMSGEFAVEPSDEMVSYLKDLLDKVENPPRARDVMIRKANLVTRVWTSSVMDTMKKMLVDDLSCIPVLENDRVAGVFSENTLLSYLVENGRLNMDDSMKIEALRKYIPVENHVSEAFPFVDDARLVSDIKKMFDKAYTNGTKRVALVFVTEDGTKNGRILGVISAWDLAGTKLRRIRN